MEPGISQCRICNAGWERSAPGVCFSAYIVYRIDQRYAGVIRAFVLTSATMPPNLSQQQQMYFSRRQYAYDGLYTGRRGAENVKAVQKEQNMFCFYLMIPNITVPVPLLLCSQHWMPKVCPTFGAICVGLNRIKKL